MRARHNGNGHQHVTETPDVSYIRNEDVTHETSDVYLRGIVTFMIGLTVMTVVVYLLMWGMFKVMYAKEEKQDSERGSSPMAMTSQERRPPEPRLQSAPGFGEGLAKETAQEGNEETGKREDPNQPKDPLWEIRTLREHWNKTLESGLKDPRGNVVVLPIAEAKRELLKKGLPTR